MNTKKWKILILSSLGGGLEFYDFVIYAIFAPYIGRAFFPSENPIVSLIETFLIFAVGYLARPIGGIIFSHMGDKIGRKKIFTLTIFIMGISSILIAILPSSEKIGISATIIFCLLRLIQGMSLGGELPCSITFICEHLKDKPGFACGTLYFFVNTGIILATAVQFLIFLILPHKTASIYGWRIAFILGGILAIISYYIRSYLEETPEFVKLSSHAKQIPIFTLFRNHFPAVLYGFLIASFGATIVAVLYLYIIGYMITVLNYTESTTNWLTFVGTFAYSFTIFLSGYLADKIGPKKIILLGIITIIVSAIPYYNILISHGSPLVLLMMFVFIAAFAGLTTGAFPVILADIFPTEIRYTGISTSYNIAYAVFCGLTPLISTYLIHISNNKLWPAYILIATALIGLIGLLGITFNKKLNKGYLFKKVDKKQNAWNSY